MSFELLYEATATVLRRRALCGRLASGRRRRDAVRRARRGDRGGALVEGLRARRGAAAGGGRGRAARRRLLDGGAGVRRGLCDLGRARGGRGERRLAARHRRPAGADRRSATTSARPTSTGRAGSRPATRRRRSAGSGRCRRCTIRSGFSDARRRRRRRRGSPGDPGGRYPSSKILNHEIFSSHINALTRSRTCAQPGLFASRSCRLTGIATVRIVSSNRLQSTGEERPNRRKTSPREGKAMRLKSAFGLAVPLALGVFAAGAQAQDLAIATSVPHLGFPFFVHMQKALKAEAETLGGIRLIELRRPEPDAEADRRRRGGDRHRASTASSSARSTRWRWRRRSSRRSTPGSRSSPSTAGSTGSRASWPTSAPTTSRAARRRAS